MWSALTQCLTYNALDFAREKLFFLVRLFRRNREQAERKGKNGSIKVQAVLRGRGAPHENERGPPAKERRKRHEKRPQLCWCMLPRQFNEPEKLKNNINLCSINFYSHFGFYNIKPRLPNCASGEVKEACGQFMLLCMFVRISAAQIAAMEIKSLQHMQATWVWKFP